MSMSTLGGSELWSGSETRNSGSGHSSSNSIPIIDLRYFSLTGSNNNDIICDNYTLTTSPITPHIHTPEEECALGPACWLWDYLRRSGACGYLLPLSGGADSASVATIVYVMCTLAVSAAKSGDIQVITDIYKLLQQDLPSIIHSPSYGYMGVSAPLPTPEELCGHILNTVYMSTQNSSQATTNRARLLSQAIGSYHHSFQFDTLVYAILDIFTTITGGRTVRYHSEGGTVTEDIALQNIQARLRMILAYTCAQLFPWVRGRKSFLLVLGSANVDESLRGYMVRYIVYSI